MCSILLRLTYLFSLPALNKKRVLLFPNFQRSSGCFSPPIFLMECKGTCQFISVKIIPDYFGNWFEFFIFFKRSSRYRRWIAKIGTDSFPTNFSPPFLFTFASQSTNNFQRSDLFFFKCGAQRYGHHLSFPSIL